MQLQAALRPLSPTFKARARALTVTTASALAILALGLGPNLGTAAGAGLDAELLAKMRVGEPYRDPQSGATFTFLQKNAGQAGPSAWRAARSLGCGFAVGMPGPFNELKITAATTDGGMLSTYSLGTRTTEGCKFTVVCTERSDRKLPKTSVADALASIAGAGTEISRSAATVQGHPAIRARIKGRGTVFGLLLLKLDGRIYEQMLECPDSEQDYFGQLEQRFFETLEVRPKGSR